MRIRADFDRREVVRPEAYDWISSPASGVDRMMLDRIGEEVARATSIVRFAPNSAFEAHTHGGGEEYLVLEGVFADEFGDYPVGTYVRNPIGTRHTPRIGPEGATIFVKLRQFAETDREQKVIHTRNAVFVPGEAEGLSELLLHDVPGELVRLVRFAPGTQVAASGAGGPEEILVLEGTLEDEAGRYPAGTWLRSPTGSGNSAMSREGCLIYIKSGPFPG